MNKYYYVIHLYIYVTMLFILILCSINVSLIISASLHVTKFLHALISAIQFINMNVLEDIYSFDSI